MDKVIDSIRRSSDTAEIAKFTVKVLKIEIGKPDFGDIFNCLFSGHAHIGFCLQQSSWIVGIRDMIFYAAVCVAIPLKTVPHHHIS